VDKTREYFRKHEDVCINFLKTRPIMATMNFKNKYIQKFIKPENEKNKLLVFSWTEFKFRHIDIRTIKSLYPLSQVLQNIE